jgi:hypothetical protein
MTKAKRPLKKLTRNTAGVKTNSGRVGQLGKATSQIVREAALLLDEEMAAGIVAAQRLQQGFNKDGSISSADLNEAVQRFQANANEVLNLLNEQFNNLRSEDNVQLVSSLLQNSHDLVNFVVEMVIKGADIANSFARTSETKKR